MSIDGSLMTRPEAQAAPTATATQAGHTRWRPSLITWFIAVVVLIGLGVALYPSTAQWFSSYNQSKIVRSYAEEVDLVNPDAGTQLGQAQMYNEALTAGVDLLAGARVPTGSGNTTTEIDYNQTLVANGEGMMARIRFPAAEVDLPIFHGTSDATLLNGAGHLEGSHLPIGGESTRSVITAHRGLATSTMFSHLDLVKNGDRFTIETFGEVLTYEVRETRVIAPEETDSLRAEPGRDLVTLVTCTPLGINTHRILVTGERVTPTPPADLASLGRASILPGFPWWAVGFGAGVLLAAAFVWRAGYTDPRNRAPQTSANEG
ncbi:class C sortase [Leucobacter sp. HY1910]